MKTEEDGGKVEKEEVEEGVKFKSKESDTATCSETRKALAANSDFTSTASSCYTPAPSNSKLTITSALSYPQSRVVRQFKRPL